MLAGPGQVHGASLTTDKPLQGKVTMISIITAARRLLTNAPDDSIPGNALSLLIPCAYMLTRTNPGATYA